jgi:hypothetical protein
MPLDRNNVRAAAEQANKLFGQWMPERWLNLFIDAYDDIEACRIAPADTQKKPDWFPYPVKDEDA